MTTDDATRAWWRATLAIMRRSRSLAVIDHAGSCLQFERGDAGNVIRDMFGDDTLAALDDAVAGRYGVDPETLRGERWVAARIPPEARRLKDGVPFTAHRVVAALPAATRDAILAEAVARATPTVRAVRDIRREHTGEAGPTHLDADMTFADYLAGRLVEQFAWIDTGQARMVAAMCDRVRAEYDRAMGAGRGKAA